jgi:hypothetical protein
MRVECVLGWQRLPARSPALIRQTKPGGLKPIRFRPTVIPGDGFAPAPRKEEPKPKKKARRRRKQPRSPRKPPTPSAKVLTFKPKAANQN